MQHSVLFEPELGQFRVHLESEHYATVKFKIEDGVYQITSTRVPDALQGKGYGKVMMEAVLPKLEELDVKIVPVCSYVVHYLDRHPEWAHLKA
ncbi:GNAT family N-acetyltransferase [Vibrio sp. MarTm2]|uniref:Acetyltransferase n=1 Tax=Vibrio variabilis TaxID=990271 RepID=A0ABR4YGB1_9VIBR|nr:MULTISPECIES: GNAT family N-acetyltransferase [Vibrio]KHA62301.1 acetyltransferase [Vibrio variabilis]KHT39371.1 acetyltransferase [Vibrio sinaloensis]MDA0128391.1 GNAT family N-acetyltransferase [Vibrio sp. MarTm2]